LLLPYNWYCVYLQGLSGQGVALTTYPDSAPRLKKEWSYTSTPPLGLHGLLKMKFTFTSTFTSFILIDHYYVYPLCKCEVCTVFTKIDVELNFTSILCIFCTTSRYPGCQKPVVKNNRYSQYIIVY